jgi:hypothetical protein
MTEQEQLKPIVVGSINVKRVVEESKRARTRPNMQEPYEIGSFAIQGREQHHGGKLLLVRSFVVQSLASWFNKFFFSFFFRNAIACCCCTFYLISYGTVCQVHNID